MTNYLISAKNKIGVNKEDMETYVKQNRDFEESEYNKLER